MITKDTLKEYLDLVGDITFDDFFDDYIDKAYDKLEDILDVTIGSDDAITQTFLLHNDHDLFVNLPISTVSSITDDDSNSYTYTNNKTKVIIDSDYTLDDTNLVLVYSTPRTTQIDELATIYVLYYFGRRHDQNNDMFNKTKRTEDGLQTSIMPIYEFISWWGDKVRDLLVWQL